MFVPGMSFGYYDGSGAGGYMSGTETEAGSNLQAPTMMTAWNSPSHLNANAWNQHQQHLHHAAGSNPALFTTASTNDADWYGMGMGGSNAAATMGMMYGSNQAGYAPMPLPPMPTAQYAGYPSYPSPYASPYLYTPGYYESEPMMDGMWGDAGKSGKGKKSSKGKSGKGRKSKGKNGKGSLNPDAEEFSPGRLVDEHSDRTTPSTIQSSVKAVVAAENAAEVAAASAAGTAKSPRLSMATENFHSPQEYETPRINVVGGTGSPYSPCDREEESMPTRILDFGKPEEQPVVDTTPKVGNTSHKLSNTWNQSKMENALQEGAKKTRDEHHVTEVPIKGFPDLGGMSPNVSESCNKEEVAKGSSKKGGKFSHGKGYSHKGMEMEQVVWRGPQSAPWSAYAEDYGVGVVSHARPKHLQKSPKQWSHLLKGRLASFDKRGMGVTAETMVHLLSFYINRWVYTDGVSHSDVIFQVFEALDYMSYHQIKPSSKAFTVAMAGYEAFHSKPLLTEHFEKFLACFHAAGFAEDSSTGFYNAHADASLMRLYGMFERTEEMIALLNHRRYNYRPGSYNCQFRKLLCQAALDYACQNHWTEV